MLGCVKAAARSSKVGSEHGPCIQDLGFSSMDVTGDFDKSSFQCRGADKTLNGVYSVKGRLLIILLLHVNNKQPKIA